MIVFRKIEKPMLADEKKPVGADVDKAAKAKKAKKKGGAQKRKEMRSPNDRMMTSGDYKTR